MQIPAPIPVAPVEAPAPIPSEVAKPAAPSGVVDGKVGKADTLGKLLKKNGLSARETDEVIRALSGVLDFKTIRAGQAFHIERGVDGRVRKFELVLGKHRVRAERTDKGDLVGKTDET